MRDVLQAQLGVRRETKIFLGLKKCICKPVRDGLGFAPTRWRRYAIYLPCISHVSPLCLGQVRPRGGLFPYAIKHYSQNKRQLSVFVLHWILEVVPVPLSVRNAEIFKAKLDALASVGYYEVMPNVHN